MSGGCILLLSALNHDVTVALIQMSVVILLLLFCFDGATPLLKSAKLLAWLVIPIVLVHSLYSPGAIILPQFAIPISMEGAKTGAGLSLHLCLLFFAALLFSRQVEKGEWYLMAVRIPRFGNRIITYIILLDQCGDEIRAIIKDVMIEWKANSGNLSKYAEILATMPSSILKKSDEIAESIWRDWDDLESGFASLTMVRTGSSKARYLTLFSAILLCMFFVAMES